MKGNAGFRHVKTHALISAVLHAMSMGASGTISPEVMAMQDELRNRPAHSGKTPHWRGGGVRKAQRAAYKRRCQLRHKAACKRAHA